MGQKLKSGLRSTIKEIPAVESSTPSNVHDIEVEADNTNMSSKKQIEIFIGTYDLQYDLQKTCIQIK